VRADAGAGPGTGPAAAMTRGRPHSGCTRRPCLGEYTHGRSPSLCSQGPAVANANLFMGLFWLALGVVLIAAHWHSPHTRWLNLLGTNVTLGLAGFASVLLSLYNFVRWYSIRSNANHRRKMEEDYERRLRAAEGRLRRE